MGNVPAAMFYVSFSVGVLLVIVAVIALFKKMGQQGTGEFEVLGLFKFKGVGGSIVFLFVGATLMMASAGWSTTSQEVSRKQQQVDKLQTEKTNIVREAETVVNLLNQQIEISQKLEERIPESDLQDFRDSHPNLPVVKEYQMSGLLGKEIVALPPRDTDAPPGAGPD